MQSFEDQVKAVEDWARATFTRDQLAALFAETALRARQLEDLMRSMMDSVSHLVEQENIRTRALKAKTAESKLLSTIERSRERMEELVALGARAGFAAAGQIASRRGSQAANVRHDKPGGAREKQEAIRKLWRNGKYQSRDVCAEQECAAVGMSFSAARKALRNVPQG